ncbi:MAG: hypothetical protein M0Z66_03420 [Thermaerobacter sp.]|nr:hypothetical protein [Thermaerobacter sp.]
MEDIAAQLSPETLEEIVKLPVLTADEIESLVHAVKQRSPRPAQLAPSVMRISEDGGIYLLGASLEESGSITIRVDIPSLAVVRSFDTIGGLRLIEGALKELPYDEITSGNRPFVVSVRLADSLMGLRMDWLRSAADLIRSARAQ